jgi:hypothetical protein
VPPLNQKVLLVFQFPVPPPLELTVWPGSHENVAACADDHGKAINTVVIDNAARKDDRKNRRKISNTCIVKPQVNSDQEVMIMREMERLAPERPFQLARCKFRRAQLPPRDTNLANARRQEGNATIQSP